MSGIYTKPYGSASINDTTPSSNTVYSSSKTQDELDNKADKVSGAIDNNFASLDSNGNLKDSGSKASDFASSSHSHNASSMEIDTTNFGGVLNGSIINLQLLADFIDDNIMLGGEILVGTIDPTSEGKAGDLYINTTSYDIFYKTGAWTLKGNIKGQQGIQGVQGQQGIQGQTGNGIDNITKTSGNSSPGTTDTYTITYTDTTTDQFTVYNGANGTGTLSSVVGGTLVTIDNTDPNNPVINWSGNSGDISYDNTQSGLSSTNVKSAIDELNQEKASADLLSWGNITGTLSSQTDLQTALDGKEDTIGAKGTAFNKDFGTSAGTVLEGNTPIPDNTDYVDLTTTQTITGSKDFSNPSGTNIQRVVSSDVRGESGNDLVLQPGFSGGGTTRTKVQQAQMQGIAEYAGDITSSVTLDNHIPNKKYVDDALAGVGGGGIETYSQAGIIVEGTEFIEYIADGAKTVGDVSIALQVVPEGADFIVTWYKNGTSVGTSTIATTATATNDRYRTKTTLSESLVDGDVFIGKVTQVGTDVKGAEFSSLVNIS